LFACCVQFDALVEFIESILDVVVGAVVDGPGEVAEKLFNVIPVARDHRHVR